MDEDRYAALAGTYLANIEEEFRCDKCLHMPARGMELMIENKRKMKGCWGPETMVEHHVARGIPRAKAEAGAGYSFPWGGIRFLGCPGNFWSPWAAGVIRLWHNYRMGNLPEAGGMMDQPAWLLDAFGALDRFEAERLKPKE